ncbi:hypothetical protein UA08_08086 [Talaromyces atroroseus]|uniref:Uncharacterized protein n=1 Tax=Talaromyces atroroseus TaxID=1441469 RepID=A0A225AQ61_TALAT|nr:hypothetical protein UA08_08086 [Talaromyces atroroseus]OKL56565.1 hypothetical protein UA08_08086 [Talaromyces atroroseus]
MVVKHTLESVLAEVDAKGKRRRDIAWKNNTPQHFNERDPNHRSALISYLTGVEVPSKAICIRCIMNSGPMQKCVVSLDRNGRYKHKACSNCRWYQKSDCCTFNKMKPCTILRILQYPVGEFEKPCLKSCNNNCVAELDLPCPSSYRGMNQERYLPRVRPVPHLIFVPPPRPASVTRPILRPLTLLRPSPAAMAMRPINNQTHDASVTLPPIVHHNDRQTDSMTVPDGYLENLSAMKARQINPNIITAETQEVIDRPYTAEDRERINLRLLSIAADHIETFGVMDPLLLI